MEGYPNTSGYIPDLVPQSANEINDDTGILPVLPNQPMDEEEFRSRVRRAIEDTATYIDSYIAPERERAMSYYLGNAFGNEEDGRSQVVMTEVRDTVLSMLPSLLRIFTGSEKVVEFVPKGPEDIQVAEQMTDLVQYIFQQENPGFRILHDVMKDALILKNGILTWNKRDDERVEEHTYSGLDQASAALILSDPSVQLIEMSERQSVSQTNIVAFNMPMQPVVEPPTIDLRIKRIVRTPRYVIECIPPEEFLIANDATSIEDALVVGRRRLATVSELVAMGYPRELIEENAGAGGFEMNMETLVRNPADQSFFGIGENTDESTDLVYYVEAYVRIDKDGDGIAELHRVHTCGNGGVVLFDEVVTDAPFALFCPDPTPHTIFGKSIADQTMDLQLIKSSIVRNTLDSLAQSIHPRTAVIETAVNMDDVLNNETGAIIRMRQAGAVQPLATPFVGQPALGVLAYLDDVKTQRTGISRASQGLDADVLQSTTRAAVQAQLSSSQDRIEMIARLFADGLKQCFKGLLRLVVENQDRPKIIRLRGKFVPIDPRGWDANMDMVVNVGLGRGSDEQRMGFLTQIAARQEAIIQQYGPMNPLTDVMQYRNTLAQIIQLAGFQDPSQFIKEVTPEALQQFMQSMQKPPQPDPAQILAQVEVEKIKSDILIAASKQELERQKAISQADLERDKLAVDAMLRAQEMQAKYGAQVDIAAIKGEVDRQRTEIQEQFGLRQQAMAQVAPQPYPPQAYPPQAYPPQAYPPQPYPGVPQ